MSRVGLVVVLATLALAVLPGAASADLNQLLAACSQKDAADNDTGTLELPYVLCDDGVPNAGGTTPNQPPATTAIADKAVPVPQKYGGSAGLPAKIAPDPLAGADVNNDIALDVDVSLPTPPATPPAGDKYPLVVMMHGCCSGNKDSWEADTIDAGGERWHYSNAWFASRGYVVLNYTARGFVNGSNQGSTGQTQLNSDLYEINDFQHLAGQLVDKGDLDPGAGVVKVDPARIVATGGSYGGGFSWMALTDPTWKSPANTDMNLAAVAAKYGWTNLIESLVPKGIDPPTGLASTDPASMSGPIGFAKQSIVAGLYASGKTGVPPGSSHTTFHPEIDAAMACLESADPYEVNPACVVPLAQTLPRFLNERSAYFENDFFTRVASDPTARVPTFSAGTFTDNLFPPSEHRRMVERLKQTFPGYPVQEYYGDYQHFVQNKAKEWGDLCGADHHVCTLADYGGNLNADPATLAREVGATTRLNRFVDAFADPPGNPSQPNPAFDVTASLQICPDNASAQFLADEPGQRFTESTFGGLAPNTLTVTAPGTQQTAFDTASQNATNADPVFNSVNNGGRCAQATSTGGQATAGPGVATYDSVGLPSDFTMIGRTRVVVQHTGSGPATQLNARLYDLHPDGKQVMVDRGFKRITSATGPTEFALNGNGWRFPAGHKVRIELTQNDDPYIKASNQPSSLSLTSVQLQAPIREASASIAGGVPPTPTESGAAGGETAGAGAAAAGVGSGAGTTRRRLRLGFGSFAPTRVRNGVFYVRCRVEGSGPRVCEVEVLVGSGASAVRRIGFGRRTVRGRSGRVRVKLNRRGRRLLRRRGRRGLRVTLRMKARDSTGRTGEARRRVRLRAARPRRR